MAFQHQEPVELPDGGQFSRLSPRGKPGIRKTFDKAAHLFRSCVGAGGGEPGQMIEILADVTRIGVARVFRCAALHGHHLDEHA